MALNPMPVGSRKRPHGIPTTYRGTRFRSRLEARWAAFFDLIEWTWVYEPFDADGWIPDFHISGEKGNGILIEVGPCDTLDSFISKAAKPLAAFPRPVTADGSTIAPERTTLVLGISPLVLPDHPGHPQAGYLTDDRSGGGPSVGIWGTCPECGLTCVTHDYMVYTHLPCGHYTGGDGGLEISGLRLFGCWTEAGNEVQWRSR